MPRSNQRESNGTKPSRSSTRRQLATIALSVALLLMPVLALKVYIVKYPLRWGNRLVMAYLGPKRLIREKKHDIFKTIILGDSVMNGAFVPECLGEDVLNLAIPGAVPSDMYYALKQYLVYNRVPESMYLSFCPWHFDLPYEFIRAVMAGFFTPRDEVEYLGNIIKFNAVPDVYTAGTRRESFMSYCHFRLLNLNSYWPYLKNAGYSRRLKENRMCLEKIYSHRGTNSSRTVSYWDSSAQKLIRDASPMYRHFMPSSLQDFYYKKIIALCMEQGIQIRIQVLPDPFDKYYNPDFLDEFKAYHEEALAGYDKWTLDTPLDLALATTGGYTIGDFADECHFNNHGSLKFSRMIRKRYPDDFAEGSVMPVSDNTLAGLEDYLCMENQADKILQWIQGTGRAEGGVPLSALFISRNGHRLEEDWRLAAVLREEYPSYAEGLVTGGYGDAACYFSGEASASIPGDIRTATLSCNGGATSLSFSDGGISLSAFDDGSRLRVRLQTAEGGQPNTAELSLNDGADLYAIVLNTRTGKLVTSKSFRFTGWSYRMLLSATPRVDEVA